MGPTPVIKVQISSDANLGLTRRGVILQIDVFIFHGSPQAFGENIVQCPPLAIHTDLRPCRLDQAQVLRAGEMTPLVTIDDVPMGGEAGHTLAMINPSSIESISFTKRINVLYGSQGNAGVISVYLKKGASISDVTPDFQRIKIPGYSSPHVFRSPDYDDARNDKDTIDFRATIYWNPRVTTNRFGSKTVSFFAADLPGKYRIIAEGITADGKPVRAEAYIEVHRE